MNQQAYTKALVNMLTNDCKIILRADEISVVCRSHVRVFNLIVIK